MTRLMRPQALRKGDQIGIVAPAGVFSREMFLLGVARIHEAGYRAIFSPGIFSRNGYLAGDDSRRAAELNSMFADPGVKAIFCARGGYGSQRILPMLKRKMIRSHPKIFMGYSDVTALHGYIQAVCGMVTFHGPLVTELGIMEDSAVDGIFDSLGRTDAWGELVAANAGILRGGKGVGGIAGGCLSIFSMLVGTPYEPETAGKVLFFEDRGEKPYAVDRLFSHLSLAGKFKGIKGMILGKFIPPAGRDSGEEKYREEIDRIVLDAAGRTKFPILRNFPAGHSPENICFPMGVRVRIDGDRGTVTVIDKCLE